MADGCFTGWLMAALPDGLMAALPDG